MRKTAIAIACAAMLAAPAAADEMWKTELGPVIWESDYDGGAVFLLNIEGGKVVRFYIEGLLGQDDSRGHFTGYWITTADEQLCTAALKGPDGTTSRTWGRLNLTFMSREFPSDWAMLTGDCHEDPTTPVIGLADTGQ